VRSCIRERERERERDRETERQRETENMFPKVGLLGETKGGRRKE
jgi:hypothetical protein